MFTSYFTNKLFNSSSISLGASVNTLNLRSTRCSKLEFTRYEYLKIIYTIPVAIIAYIYYNPAPTARPIHVIARSPEAVVSPLTLNPLLSIVPAPIKPIPDSS